MKRVVYFLFIAFAMTGMLSSCSQEDSDVVALE